ncbi:MAG: response regulator [Deltaproteobacteria bacterium]|nr:response regulator [Deltaproteobacteria bacterium]
MNEVRPRVFFISDEDSLGSSAREKLSELIERTKSAVTENLSDATCIIGLGDPENWPSVEVQVASTQVVYVWFESFFSEEIYKDVIDKLPSVTFFHGNEGLSKLIYLLEEGGVLKAGEQSDPLADDVFFRLRGDYLHQVEDEVTRTQKEGVKSGDAKVRVWEKALGKIAGSAGTYEFEDLSRMAFEFLEIIENDAKSPKVKDFGGRLQAAVTAEFELYRRQVEECLPARVELDVRQRVLACVDDEQIANQLRFALSHSRMQTVLHDNPAAIIDAIQSIQPDILVVQQSMRHFDGLDLAAYIRRISRFESLPILALLNESSQTTLTRATRGGVDTWLTIPFSAANVALCVLNLLRRVEVARKLGGRDALTGLYTKEAMMDHLKGDLSRVRRSGQQLAVMLVHLIGVESPRLAFLDLASTANRVFRQSDLLARYNEATLAAVLPGVDTSSIISVISRLRLLFNAHTFETVATISDGTASPDALLADVESRLTRVLGGFADNAIGVYTSDDDEASGGGAPRILLADTDEAIVNLLKFFCAREGFEVDDVRTGTDVLEYLEKEKESGNLPDVLILEAFLPGVDGFQILEKVQEEYGNRIAVIMLSVRSNEERVSEAFKLGASDFIAKPFRVPEVMARIRNGLTRVCAV